MEGIHTLRSWARGRENWHSKHASWVWKQGLCRLGRWLGSEVNGRGRGARTSLADCHCWDAILRHEDLEGMEFLAAKELGTPLPWPLRPQQLARAPGDRLTFIPRSICRRGRAPVLLACSARRQEHEQGHLLCEFFW